MQADVSRAASVKIAKVGLDLIFFRIIMSGGYSHRLCLGEIRGSVSDLSLDEQADFAWFRIGGQGHFLSEMSLAVRYESDLNLA